MFALCRLLLDSAEAADAARRIAHVEHTLNSFHNLTDEDKARLCREYIQLRNTANSAVGLAARARDGWNLVKTVLVERLGDEYSLMSETSDHYLKEMTATTV